MLCSCSKAYVMLCQVMLCWATTKQKYLIHCFTVRIKIGFLRHSPIIFMSLPVVKVVKGSKIAFKKILLWHSAGYPFLKIVHLMCKFQTNRMHWIQMSYFSVMIVGEIKLFQASTTTKYTWLPFPVVNYTVNASLTWKIVRYKDDLVPA